MKVGGIVQRGPYVGQYYFVKSPLEMFPKWYEVELTDWNGNRVTRDLHESVLEL